MKDFMLGFAEMEELKGYGSCIKGTQVKYVNSYCQGCADSGCTGSAQYGCSSCSSCAAWRKGQIGK